jgi:hypothetical protein
MNKAYVPGKTDLNSLNRDELNKAYVPGKTDLNSLNRDELILILTTIERDTKRHFQNNEAELENLRFQKRFCDCELRVKYCAMPKCIAKSIKGKNLHPEYEACTYMSKCSKCEKKFCDEHTFCFECLVCVNCVDLCSFCSSKTCNCGDARSYNYWKHDKTRSPPYCRIDEDEAIAKYNEMYENMCSVCVKEDSLFCNCICKNEKCRYRNHQECTIPRCDCCGDPCCPKCVRKCTKCEASHKYICSGCEYCEACYLLLFEERDGDYFLRMDEGKNE